jgi:hypothetical protein
MMDTAEGMNRGPQLSLLDVGPARRAAMPDFWTREREDREDYRDRPRDEAEQE